VGAPAVVVGVAGAPPVRGEVDEVVVDVELVDEPFDLPELPHAAATVETVSSSAPTVTHFERRRIRQCWLQGRSRAWQLRIVDCMTTTDDLLANNRAYVDAFDKGDLPVPPKLKIAVVACMDARVNPYGILGLTEGDAHVIRNGGGVITDDVIRSLVISQRLLGTTDVMLIHHTGCGMLTFHDDEVKAQIEADTGLRPPFALEAFGDVDDDVRQSIRRVQTNPYLPHSDTVRGFVYETETGRVREVKA
jgi:carbonic anhydrase